MSGLTIDSPVTWATVLASDRILPGDTLYLRAGTYAGGVFLHGGNAGLPVTVCPYADERVIIDGNLTLIGDYVTVRDVESTNSTPRDRSAKVGSVGFDCLGDHVEILNCYIHDHDQGITTSAAVTGHRYSGNLITACGWNAAAGHGMYPQNAIGNTKEIADNILWGNFGYGIHCWGTNGDISDFHVHHNVSFCNGNLRGWPQAGLLVARQGAHQGNILHNNISYQPVTDQAIVLICGNTGNPSTGWQVYDNQALGGWYALAFYEAQIDRLDGNRCIGPVSGWSLDTWPDNPVTAAFPLSGVESFLYPNPDDASRASLTVLNWAGLEAVTVDVSAVYAAGERVAAHNAQDYGVDVQSVAVAGDGTITLDMQAANRSVMSPVGWTAAETTFPTFGCFILEA